MQERLIRLGATVFPGLQIARDCRDIAGYFDPAFYRQRYPEIPGSDRALARHYLLTGWRDGFDPSAEFSTKAYLDSNPDVAQSGMNPLLHFVRYGRHEGREMQPSVDDRPQRAIHRDADPLDAWFDRAFYLSSFPRGETPVDPLRHFLEHGWKEGRDPAPWFSVRHYLAQHPDVAEAGVNPFTHYVFTGREEGRKLTRLGQGSSRVYDAHEFAVNPGPQFEEFDPMIGAHRPRAAKVLAFYLPQFHAVDVNDEHWGTGFTEWRNLPRAMPRFDGHLQPRIPRDLGFYDLAQGDALKRQIDLAKAAGLHGFAFYYYWFDGTRVLETPLERLLNDPELDIPFCLIWANENWTRTWDGADAHIILEQSHDPRKDRDLVRDWARHMADDRYIRLEGRPLLIIYRPGQIPDASAAIERWRTLFRTEHALDPIIMMVQGFGDEDPRPFGLDGAVEFPPHKLAQDLPPINAQLDWFDDSFTGHVLDYDAIMDRSLDEAPPDFPLIKTTIPSWDNEARRPGRSMVVHGQTPEKFERWMRRLIDRARSTPVFGEPIVCVNAWNEWAEGAVLEPDVHSGAAYLNALSRAIHKVPQPISGGPGRVVIVGHDANRNGAQLLALNLGRTLKEAFGVSVTFLLVDGGPLLEDYSAIGETEILGRDPEHWRSRLRDLHRKGLRHAITNTTATGLVVPTLKQEGFEVVSLIHELPRLLRSMNLEEAAAAIADQSEHVIFPADVVRDAFEEVAGPVRHRSSIFPQGLYNAGLLDAPREDGGLRAEFSLPADATLILGAGYGDLRKGVDRFVAAGISLCAARDDVAFIWLGSPSADMAGTIESEIASAGLNGRILITGFRDDIDRFFAASDLFYLSSREDPFPSVVLEALASGLPVVGHRGCGGCDALIERFGDLIPDTSGQAAATAIANLLGRGTDSQTHAARARREAVSSGYDFQNYAFGLLTRFASGLASVSAVVPNYNYAPYLDSRLSTVFAQSHPLRDVVVLDDLSSDNSVDVITQTAKAAGRQVSLILNDTNSGSPFKQWRKGAELAKGDYVWIAEADDLASPDLVDRLVTRMRDTGAVLGFCDSAQIDERSVALGDSYKSYVNDIEPGAFDQEFTMDGPDFLARFLAVKNVILNASGVIFRKDALLAAFDRCMEDLLDVKIAGDWRLYAEICSAGGRVFYSPEPLNVHRRHRSSVTHATDITRHLQEIEAMQALVRSRVDLDARVIRLQQAHYDACARHLKGL